MSDAFLAETVDALDTYFDAAPRADAEAVDTGAFSLFVSSTPWSYYARPAIGHREPITPADLDRLSAVCAAHGVGLTIEWVHEVHSELAEVALAYGLDVSSHALMVADPAQVAAPGVDGVTLRVVTADDPGLLSGRAVAHVSFTVGGTAVLHGGVDERDASIAELSPELVEHLRDRARRGLTVTAVAVADDGVVATGAYQPVGHVAEVLAIATLPERRRQGLAGAVTTLLARHAGEHGVTTVLLSAQDDEVARVYERVGFRRIGTTHAAQRPE